MLRILNANCVLYPPNLSFFTNFSKKYVLLQNKSSLKTHTGRYHARNTFVSSKRSEGGSDERYTAVGLGQDLMPKHLAVIFDGNRRWLKAHSKDLDYRPLYQAHMLLVDLCLKWGVATATSYIHGPRLLGRPKEAHDIILRQLQEWLHANSETFIRKRVRVSVIGERLLLDESIQSTIKEVEKATRGNNNNELELILAVYYEGRNDIVKATRTICKKVKAGEIDPETVNETTLQQHLSTNINVYPNPDLLIRTGGELFLSNFMMWELARTELYFTEIYPPDFSEAHFLEALRSFQKREQAFDK